MKTTKGEAINKMPGEVDRAARLLELQTQLCPQMGSHWSLHSNIFRDRIALSRILYLDHLYQQIIHVPGIICEFGVQWGGSLTTLMNLRGMYEPYNYSRTIVGFDTFQGFAGTGDKDGQTFEDGDYTTIKDYEAILAELLALHEENSPLSHIKKHELVKGDVSKTIAPWLASNEHAVIAMAIFDMDIYQPTKDALNAIKHRLVKGSLLVFDELNCAAFPGETAAVAEVFGLENLKLRRHPHQPFCSWVIWGE